MNNWKKYKLGEFTEITSSKRIFFAEYVSEGVPFWRSKEVIEQFNKKDISTELYITLDKYNEIKTKFGVPLKDDILLTSVGTIGIPYLVKENDFFYFKDGNLTWFKNYKSNLLPKFLYYWLISDIGVNNIKKSLIGSTQQAITINALKDLDIEIPNLETQTRIANFLSQFDDKIELNRQMNKNLEELAQLKFKTLLKDNFETEKTTFSNYVKISTGKGLKKEFIDNKGIYNVLGANGSIGKTNEFLFDDKLIVTGRVGTIGNVYLSYDKVWISDNVLISKALKDEYFYFSYLLLKTFNFYSITKGSTQPLITQTDLNNYIVPLLNDKIIFEFENFLRPIYEKIKYNKKQNETLANYRDSILPKIMSGEIEI